jgi:hypothetical protein
MAMHLVGSRDRSAERRQRGQVDCAASTTAPCGELPVSPIQPQTVVAGLQQRVGQPPVELRIDTEASCRPAECATSTKGREARPAPGQEAASDECSPWLHVLPSTPFSFAARTNIRKIT